MTDSQSPPDSLSPGGEDKLRILDELRERFGEQVLQAEVDDRGTLEIEVDVAVIVEVCRFLSQEIDAPYTHLSDAFGADYEDHIQVVYHLFRPTSGENALVRTDLRRDNAVMPTLTGLYNTANWAEREISEMFGVIFEGHPDPRKLLLPEDWQGYPLRKDYQRPDHPYLAPEPLHEDPPAFLAGESESAMTEE